MVIRVRYVVSSEPVRLLFAAYLLIVHQSGGSLFHIASSVVRCAPLFGINTILRILTLVTTTT